MVKYGTGKINHDDPVKRELNAISQVPPTAHWRPLVFSVGPPTRMRGVGADRGWRTGPSGAGGAEGDPAPPIEGGARRQDVGQDRGHTAREGSGDVRGERGERGGGSFVAAAGVAGLL